MDGPVLRPARHGVLPLAVAGLLVAAHEGGVAAAFRPGRLSADPDRGLVRLGAGVGRGLLLSVAAANSADGVRGGVLDARRAADRGWDKGRCA